MPTKAKSSATTSAAPAKEHNNPLGDKLNGAMALFCGGKFKEAQTALTALLAEAREVSDYGMVHTVRATLTTIEARLAKAGEGKELPEMVATLHLNKQESEAALEVLEKALKADGSNAHLHFLKATALAQLDKSDEAAEALKNAIAIDPELKVLFRLERDFDGVRYDSVFAAFERD